MNSVKHCLKYSRMTLHLYNCHPFQPKNVLTYMIPKRHAGHSKWQNIRHIKAAKDNEKQKVAESITRRIKVAISEGGGPDPMKNLTLSRLLNEGKSKGVPNSTLQNAIKRIVEKKTGNQKVVYELRGPGNSFFIVEALTDRQRHVKDLLRNACKKFGGSVGDSGFASHCFDLRGVVYVPQQENNLTEDEVLELAIDAGAEEVEATYDDGHNPAYQLLCDTKELHKVKKSIEEKNVNVTDSRLEYVPHTFAFLNESELDIVSQFMDTIENVDDVTKVYGNVKSDKDL